MSTIFDGGRLEFREVQLSDSSDNDMDTPSQPSLMSDSESRSTTPIPLISRPSIPDASIMAVVPGTPRGQIYQSMSEYTLPVETLSLDGCATEEAIAERLRFNLFFTHPEEKILRSILPMGAKKEGRECKAYTLEELDILMTLALRSDLADAAKEAYTADDLDSLKEGQCLIRFALTNNSELLFGLEGNPECVNVRDRIIPAHDQLSQTCITAGNLILETNETRERKITFISNKTGHFKAPFNSLIYLLKYLVENHLDYLADSITIASMKPFAKINVTKEELMQLVIQKTVVRQTAQPVVRPTAPPYMLGKRGIVRSPLSLSREINFRSDSPLIPPIIESQTAPQTAMKILFR